MRWIPFLGLCLLLSSCEHENTFQRAYVISQSTVEPEVEPQAQAEPDSVKAE